MELYLQIFEKIGDGFILEMNISKYDITILNEICPPEEEGDYYYCGGYFIEEFQFNKLKKIIKELANYDYDSYDYNFLAKQSW